jgi:hypothetical protein
METSCARLYGNTFEVSRYLGTHRAGKAPAYDDGVLDNYVSGHSRGHRDRLLCRDAAGCIDVPESAACRAQFAAAAASRPPCVILCKVAVSLTHAGSLPKVRLDVERKPVLV